MMPKIPPSGDRSLCSSLSPSQRKKAAWLLGVIFLFLFPGHMGASSWNPTVLVNTEAFHIVDEGDQTSDVELRFGDSLNERLYWDRANALFVLTDDLIIQGTMSGVSLTISSLKSCDTIDTDAQGVLSCGTDSSGGGGSSFGTGNVLTIGDARYVDQAGDTMTGNLIIASTSGSSAVNLAVRGMMSGYGLWVGAGNITSSGSLKVAGTMSGGTIAGANLVDCEGTANKLTYDTATQKFLCEADQTGTGGGASLTRIAGSSGAAGADITWQNLTANSADCTTTALCSAVMTTTGVGAGTWKYKYTLIYQSAATTTGIGFGIDHTGTVGQIQHMWYHLTTGGAAATGIGDNDTATAAGQLMEGKQESVDNTLIGSATAGVAVVNTDIMAILEGIIVVTGSGNLELKIASEVASSAVRVMADSTLELIKVE